MSEPCVGENTIWPFAKSWTKPSCVLGIGRSFDVGHPSSGPLSPTSLLQRSAIAPDRWNPDWLQVKKNLGGFSVTVAGTVNPCTHVEPNAPLSHPSLWIV